MENLFNGFESTKPSFQQLEECSDHLVKIARVGMVDSFHQINGELKEKTPNWSDPTPQFYAVFVSLSGKGSITHRFNGLGYSKRKHFDELKWNSGGFVEDKATGYAMSKNDAGQYVRDINAENSANCQDIFNQFFTALTMPVGSSITDLDKAIEEQKPLAITVTKDAWTNPETNETSDQYRVTRFRKDSGATVAVASTEDAEDLV